MYSASPSLQMKTHCSPLDSYFPYHELAGEPELLGQHFWRVLFCKFRCSWKKIWVWDGEGDKKEKEKKPNLFVRIEWPLDHRAS